MEQFPIFLNMANFPCAVVGGGEVAYRKISALLKAKAQICVISPEINADIKALVQNKQIDWQQQNWQADSIAGKRLVVAATDNNQVNKQIFEYCEAHNILVNTVDQPDLCRYTTPSIVDRSPIVIAISSPSIPRSISISRLPSFGFVKDKPTQKEFISPASNTHGDSSHTTSDVSTVSIASLKLKVEDGSGGRTKEKFRPSLDIPPIAVFRSRLTPELLLLLPVVLPTI